MSVHCPGCVLLVLPVFVCECACLSLCVVCLRSCRREVGGTKTSLTYLWARLQKDGIDVDVRLPSCVCRVARL